jgi:hypothetical protein
MTCEWNNFKHCFDEIVSEFLDQREVLNSRNNIYQAKIL